MTVAGNGRRVVNGAPPDESGMTSMVMVWVSIGVTPIETDGTTDLDKRVVVESTTTYSRKAALSWLAKRLPVVRLTHAGQFVEAWATEDEFDVADQEWWPTRQTWLGYDDDPWRAEWVPV